MSSAGRPAEGDDGCLGTRARDAARGGGREGRTGGGRAATSFGMTVHTYWYEGEMVKMPLTGKAQERCTWPTRATKVGALPVPAARVGGRAPVFGLQCVLPTRGPRGPRGWARELGQAASRPRGLRRPQGRAARKEALQPQCLFPGTGGRRPAGQRPCLMFHFLPGMINPGRPPSRRTLPPRLPRAGLGFPL